MAADILSIFLFGMIYLCIENRDKTKYPNGGWENEVTALVGCY